MVLASASPRRSELLARLGMVFDVRPAEVDEAPLAGEDPVDLVRRLALAKAEAGLAAAAEPDVVVLAADTVVVLDGAVLGKPIEHEYNLFELLRRPEVSYAALITLPVPAMGGEGQSHGEPEISAKIEMDPAVIEQLEISAKYQGYIDRQADEVAKSASYENTVLPANLDYGTVAGLSNEVKQKLALHKPQTIGQASRVQGITPAAISLLLIHLKRHNLSQAA